uniref:Uncharacterized protein n=1 Tax=Sander lucioperca TaxID=283035 RepID=A0A8C9ZLW9_SANLU
VFILVHCVIDCVCVSVCVRACMCVRVCVFSCVEGCFAFWCCPCFACRTTKQFGQCLCLPLLDVFGCILVVSTCLLCVQGSLCSDCLCSTFCVPCVWCQMAREMKERQLPTTTVFILRYNLRDT